MCILQTKMLTLLMICQVLATSEVMQDENAALIESRESIRKESIDNDEKTIQHSIRGAYNTINGDQNLNIVFSFIQAIFSDRDLTQSIVMNEFSVDQVLCIAMQKIVLLMLNNIEHHDFQAFVDYAKTNQISDLIFPSELAILQYLQRLNDLLHLECPQIPNIRFPNRWQSTIRQQYTCQECSHYNDIEVSFYKSYSGKIHTLQENILDVENACVPEDAEKKFTCEKCSHVTFKSTGVFNDDLPAVFVVLDDPTGAAKNYNSSKKYEFVNMACEQVQSKTSDASAKLKEAPETLKIKSFNYEMYAKIHFTRDSEDHIACSYTIIKNGNGWHSYPKKEIKKISHGGAFDDKEKEGKEKNPLINDSSVSESNGWLYFYRKVTE